jgi:hypothetical protein
VAQNGLDCIIFALQTNLKPMLILGFAHQFYTLWDVTESPVYVTDAYGNHHLARVNHQFNYIKNVAIDKADAMAKYPNVPIDENLRGKSRSFSEEGADQRPTDIVWFGKYAGLPLAEVADKNFEYILWMHENCGRYVDAIEALPQYQKHLADIASKRSEALSNAFSWKQGSSIDIVGTRNGYNCVPVDEIGEDGLRYCLFDAELPTGEPVCVKANDCRLVSGKYPYIMPVVNGKAVKTKNKAFTITPSSFQITLSSNNEIQYFITL